jgi:hypothetical protein
VSVRLEVDDRAVQAALTQLAAGLDDLEPGWSRVADRMRAAARPRVPVQSGRLLGDVAAIVRGDGVEFTVGGPDVPYAGPINFGWSARNIEPAGFMEAAEQAAEENAAGDVSAAIVSLIRRVGLN